LEAIERTESSDHSERVDPSSCAPATSEVWHSRGCDDPR
jgi:hypothetical protein